MQTAACTTSCISWWFGRGGLAFRSCQCLPCWHCSFGWQQSTSIPPFTWCHCRTGRLRSWAPSPCSLTGERQSCCPSIWGPGCHRHWWRVKKNVCHWSHRYHKGQPSSPSPRWTWMEACLFCCPWLCPCAWSSCLSGIAPSPGWCWRRI